MLNGKEYFYKVTFEYILMKSGKSGSSVSIGGIAFIIGLIVAVLAGFLVNLGVATVVVLLILGLIIGLLNVTGSEATPFLIATIALMIAGSASLGVIPGVGSYVTRALSAVVIFVAPAAIVVAVKQIYGLAKN